MHKINVGDTVSWRGCWGSEDPLPAKVEKIEINTNGGKDGDSVMTAYWHEMTRENAILSLDNGHWCYGNQVSPA
jgi:hypothetical protein